MSGAVRVVAVLIVTVAIGLGGVYLGAWWAPFVAGVLLGVAFKRARWAVVTGSLTGLISWSVPLIALQLQFGLKQTSLSLAAIIGFDGAATIPLGLTVVVGLLLGLTGAWLGSAVRALLPARLRPVEKLRDQRLEVKDPVLTKR